VMNKAGELSDTSVFVGMVTGANGHPYVVVSLVEQAGFGAAISAPIVRRVIEGLVGLPTPPLTGAAGSD
jgi:cell division protein FtsI/penicillin-binding protein 2